MKKLFTILSFLAFFSHSYGSSVKKSPEPNATEIMISVGNSGKSISLKDLSTIKISEFEKLNGKKMKWLDKIGFKIGQHKLASSINADGTINNKTLAKQFKYDIDGETGFHLGGFALGFFLGLIGVLIAYLIKDEKKSNRVLWAWIGFGLLVLIILIAHL